MEKRKAQALVDEMVGHLFTDDVVRALLIVLAQGDILERAELNFIKKWAEDAKATRG